MSFDADMARIIVTVDARHTRLFHNIVAATKSSITDGSLVTGAPGQPVDTGALKASYQTSEITKSSALISTKLVYAPVIEHNLRGATLRSTVGGFHSVALTVAGFGRLVEDEVKKLGAP